jgi:anaerobic dimethyl sulfoxide reductase subunit B (iron-sulfur subunit)
MSTEYGILFLGEHCIQCHGCEIACKSWRSVEAGVKWRRVDNMWRGSYPNISITSASIACMHCVEPPCVEACPEGAIEKRTADGIVMVDRDACTGCGVCLDVCPFGVPQFGTDGKMQKCDLCIGLIDMDAESPPCVTTCPTHALVFSTMSSEEKRAAEQSLIQKI